MPSSDREAALFAEALKRPEPVRAGFLDEACGGDEDLRLRIEALLAAHARADEVLPPLPDGDTGTAPMEHAEDRVEETIGQVIGPYKVREKIGMGGCGVVYVAEQTAPIRRLVALKVIKLGMDTKAVVARFQAERQALALMDHPHIAKVFDAGATESGRPYFVMELVRGIPITVYCDQNNLCTEERLRLFIPVCQAIQHAHQKGIIHRDIKPSNILVTLHDGVPVPKVIDFGIAKATEGRLTDATVYTQLHQFLGTPAYMSPEQAEMSGLDIDTRSDIYSLGVLLYELLTGTTPYDTEATLAKGIDAVRKIIREQEPARPSTRFSSLADEQRTTTAKRRAVESARLVSILRGDLDWVVLKCLEKDRTRRYETANGLAMDLARYLGHEPVVAAAPTPGYKLRKFVQRNRGLVLAGSLVLLALLAGMAGTTSGWIEARRQQHIAEQETAAKEAARQEATDRAEGERQAKLAAEEALVEAEQERARAQAVADFVTQGILAFTSVEGQARFEGEELTGNATLRELLDRAADKLQEREDLPPLIEAELNWIIGVSYRGMVEHSSALPFLQRAYDLRRRELTNDHPDTLTALNSLAVAHLALDQPDRVLALMEQAGLSLDPDCVGHHSLVEQLMATTALAKAQIDLGRVDTAIPFLEKVLAVLQDHVSHPIYVVTTMCKLLGAYEAAGRWERCLEMVEEHHAYATRELGPTHPETIHSLAHAAHVLASMAQFVRAAELATTAVAAARERFGDDHLRTMRPRRNRATILHAWAHALGKQGESEKAADLLREAIAIVREVEPSTSPVPTEYYLCLATTLRQQDRPDEIEAIVDPWLAAATQIDASDHLKAVWSLTELANTLMELGRADEIEAIIDPWLGTVRQSDAPDTIETARHLAMLAGTLMQLNRSDDSDAIVDRWLATARRMDAPDTIESASILAYLSVHLLNRGDYADAAPMARRSLAIRERLMPDDWLTYNAKCLVGRALLGKGELAEAEQLLEEGLQGMLQREEEIPEQGRPRITESFGSLINLYETRGEEGDDAKAVRYRDMLQQRNG